MAYNKSAQSSNNVALGTNDQGNFRKANGFINFGLIQPDGSAPKFGAIPTYVGDNLIGQIHAFLTVKGVDEAETAALRVKAAQAFLNSVTITFVEVPDEPRKLVMPSLN